MIQVILFNDDIISVMDILVAQKTLTRYVLDSDSKLGSLSGGYVAHMQNSDDYVIAAIILPISSELQHID